MQIRRVDIATPAVWPVHDGLLPKNTAQRVQRKQRILGVQLLFSLMIKVHITSEKECWL